MTIPSNQLVNVTPSVLSAGGAGLATIGLVLDNSTAVPLGSVLSFPNAISVLNYFGPGILASGAAIYFSGFEGSQQTPAALLVAQYNATAVAAYIRGAQITVPLATLVGYSGSLNVVVDGYARNVGSINLAGSASFTAAASTIQSALNASPATLASFTGAIGWSATGTQSGTNLTVSGLVAGGTIFAGDTVTGTGVVAGTTIVSQTSGTTGGNGVYVTSLAGTANGAAIVGTSNVLDVSSSSSGTLAVGQTVENNGVTPVAITALGTGTGGAGTYILGGAPQQVASGSMITIATPVSVTYSSVSGGFFITSGITGTASSIAFATGTLAALLLLTQATGAVISAGAAATTPAAFMNALIQVNSNWVAFKTVFDPDNGVGNTQKQAFAAWSTSALGGNRFAYVCTDSDITPTQTVPATTSLGQILAGNSNSGTILVWEPATGGPFYGGWLALGIIASINFGEQNGRITFAYKITGGVTAGVTTATVANNLAGNPQGVGNGNGYNFIGAYATAGTTNTWFQRGTITGPFLFADSYINQIWLNNQFQIALLALLGSALSIPFNNSGYNQIQQALASPIAAGLSFGAYAPGPISASQAQSLNAATGSNNAATTLQAQGWFLQIVNPSAAVIQARGPLQVNFWYNDRGSVQVINLTSVDVI